MSDEGSIDLNDPTTASLLGSIKQLMTGPAVSKVDGSTLTGFSDDEIKATYSQACQLLQANQLKEAGKLFAMLVAMRHTEGKFWRGLALCAHKSNFFPVAEFLYTMALRWNPDDVIARVFLAEVYLALHRHAAARKHCEQAIDDGTRLAATQRDLGTYVKRAQKVLQFVSGAEDAGADFQRV